MPRLTSCRFLSLLLLLTPGSVLADDKPTHPKLQQELLARMKAEQKARFALIDQMKKGVIKDPSKLKPDHPILKEIAKLDAENQKWLAGVIEKHGWPGKTKVGVNGAHAAWLLVQHADRNRAFQKKCLALMQKQPKGEVAGTDIAYLVDRVRVGEGKKQLYGTQLHQVKGKLVPRPIEDPENLDQRRKEAGMPTMKAYLEMVRALYAGQTKPKK